MKIISFGGTDQGKRRNNNEDAYLLDDERGLYAVADGIGGSEGGEVASHIAVESLAEAVVNLIQEKEQTAPPGAARTTGSESTLLRQAVTVANNEIQHAQDQHPELAGMGTTLVTLLFRKEVACIAHVGDSRAYLLRSGEFKQLTEDHSFVADQVRSGVMTPEQAKSSPYRHMITRALGTADEIQPDVAQQRVQKNDKFLLCTDGLTEMVADEDIGRILAAAAPREAVQQLLAAANNAGGVDNITAVVVWVSEM
jgi:serine/threonine protein phosphatase PrpC